MHGPSADHGLTIPQQGNMDHHSLRSDMPQSIQLDISHPLYLIQHVQPRLNLTPCGLSIPVLDLSMKLSVQVHAGVRQ